MLTIKETNIDGSIKELTFSSKTEAAEAIRTFFGFEKSEAQRKAEQRQQLNSALRQEWQRGHSVSQADVMSLLDQARREL